MRRLTPRPRTNPVLDNNSPLADDEYLEVHDVADKIEVRMARAFELSIRRLENRISENALLEALTLGDINKVMKLFSLEILQDILEPVGTIVNDAVIRGGKEGAADLREGRIGDRLNG